MNVPSLVVLALVGLAARLAIRYMIRHRGENGCGGCYGSCSGCEGCSECSIAGVNVDGIEDENRDKSTK